MSPRAPPSTVRPLLVVAPASPERPELFGSLEGRSDLRVVYVTTVSAAVDALAGAPIALLIAAPDLPTASVTELLAARERAHPALPVLVIRDRQSEEPPGWERSGVGVLRRPLLTEALGRSVDVVLGLAGRGN